MATITLIRSRISNFLPARLLSSSYSVVASSIDRPTLGSNSKDDWTHRPMVGPMRPPFDADYDPGRWICSLRFHGVKFSSQNALFYFYIKTLAAVVGSGEAAREKIYLASCQRDCLGFGAEIDLQTSKKLRELPYVLFVHQDNFSDAMNKYAKDHVPQPFASFLDEEPANEDVEDEYFSEDDHCSEDEEYSQFEFVDDYDSPLSEDEDLV